MPIKRLMKSARFPQIGVLRKGDKKVDERKPGRDLTYFRFVATDQGAIGRGVEQAFLDAYGPQPQIVNIRFAQKTAAECFTFWQEHWVAGGLMHRCDGETCTLWRKPDGSYSTEPKPCPGGCKEVGYMDVLIPELGRLAVVTVLTTSLNDIMELQENLLAAEMLRGDLRGIPFLLRRRPRMVSTPGQDGKRVRREKWLLCVETAPVYVALQIADMEHRALPATIYHQEDEQPPALPAGVSPLPIPVSSPFEEGVFEEDEESVQPVAPAKPTNGKKLTRQDYLNRISEIELQLVAAGSGVDIDQTFLDTASIDDLVKFGKELKAKLEGIKAVSPVLPGMEVQPAGAYSE